VFKEALVPCYDLCIGLFEISVGKTASEPQEVVTEEISNVETKVKANDLKVNVNAAYLSELITKKVMEALEEAGVV
jgi:deoxyribose-phosphate aldolase